MTLVLQTEDLSKMYRLGIVGTGTLSHDINRWWHLFRGKEDPYAQLAHVNDRTKQTTGNAADSDADRAASDFVWALKNINLEVAQGEILGIIGRNGAGKSTLLKLLSRITSPTTGNIKIKGRIASLLEVGTGFHPDLTGRENIYLNGAILGMRKREIDATFDAIVEFSGCALYVDTPVKRYSSGMMVRLGFAVAAHLQSEILIVDEVLAVGDWDFQKKCIEKMQQISRSGRTLLFVSHNLASVRQLCTRAIILNCGSLESMGTTDEMIDRYMRIESSAAIGVERVFAPVESKPFQVLRAFMAGTGGEPQKRLPCGEPLFIKMECDSRHPLPGLYGYIEIARSDGTTLLVSDSFDSGDNPLNELPPGRHELTIKIPERVLGHGQYQVLANFTSRAVDSFNVDSPGIVATFELYDDETRRGNQRGGFLSVAPAWEVRHPKTQSISSNALERIL